MGNTCYQISRQVNIFQGQLNFDTTQTYLPPEQISNSKFANFNPEKQKQYQNDQKQQQFSGKYLQKHLICQKTFSSHLQTLYKQCCSSYQQHYIDQAGQKAQRIQYLCKLGQEKHFTIDLLKQQIQFLQQVKTERNDVLDYQTQINTGGWQVKRQDQEMKISCRRENDGTVGCRIQAIIDVPFQVLISVLIQIQHYTEFTPFLQISRAQKQVSRNCRIGYSLSSIPLMTKREAYFQGIGYSRLNHKSEQLFLFTRSLHDKSHLQELLQFPVLINHQYIQLDYKYFVIRYHPIKNCLGRIDMSMNVDSKMKYIPTWLMEKISKDFGRDWFRNVLKISKQFQGSKWQQSVKQNPGLFLYFKKQVDQYLKNKQQLNQNQAKLTQANEKLPNQHNKENNNKKQINKDNAFMVKQKKSTKNN